MVRQASQGERGTDTDGMTDMRAKMTKLKRQALNFKNKLSEAVAARDLALAELQSSKEVRTRLKVMEVWSAP